MARRTNRTSDRISGDTETMRIAATLGQTARAERLARRQTLNDVAARVGVSRARLSEIERGAGGSAPMSTWVAIGMAVERPLAVTFSKPLVTIQDPADAGHLEIQEFMLALAATTGRHGTFEVPTRPLDPTRSTDVGIRDIRHRARILAECWNTFGDLGAAVRATNRKAAEAAATWPDDRVAVVWIVRASAANRALVARYPHILAAAFTGSSRQWVRALTDAAAPPPDLPGLVWFDSAKKRLTEWRRATMAT